MPKVTQAHVDARRLQILQAACVCFARKGFHRTTVQDICKTAGLSPGALYGYFASKEDLIKALADENSRANQSLFDELDPGESARESLAALTRIFFATSQYTGSEEDPVDMNRIKVSLWAELARNPELVPGCDDAYETVLRELAKIVRRGQRRGELRRGIDPRMAAHLLVALLEGYTLQRAFDDSLDPERYADALWAVLDGGLTHEIRTTGKSKEKGRKS